MKHGTRFLSEMVYKLVFDRNDPRLGALRGRDFLRPEPSQRVFISGKGDKA